MFFDLKCVVLERNRYYKVMRWECVKRNHLITLNKLISLVYIIK